MTGWLGCGMLLLSVSCSSSGVGGKRSTEPSHASVDVTGRATAAWPAGLPTYPNGTITKVETGPDGTTLLLETKKSWEELRSFYAAKLEADGWRSLPDDSPGQPSARFARDGHVLILAMQPGRQEKNLVRIVYPASSAEP